VGGSHVSNGICPKCGEGLGLLRAEDAKVGAIFRHNARHTNCNAILVLVDASSPATLEMRLATDAEKRP
jgi:hypothetical protein